LTKYYYKPILKKVQEAYLANAHKEYEAGFDIESNVKLVIDSDTVELADIARYGFIDIGMWELYQTED
jgi:hypothetical protein